MLDGTHPHVIDPKYPGALDKIVHLGEYLDDQALAPIEPRSPSCEPSRARRTSERIATSPLRESSTTRSRRSTTRGHFLAASIRWRKS